MLRIYDTVLQMMPALRRLLDAIERRDGDLARQGRKALHSVALNLGAVLDHMTTANLDMLRQYRAETNVVSRPPGKGISIIGQHELLLPLVRMAVLSKLAARGWKATRAAVATKA